jgi:hypothetical protein
VRSTRSPTPRAAFEGDLAFLSLPELLHHVCHAQRDRLVEISDGESVGHIVVQRGKVVRCSAGNASGMSAFCHLIKLRSGHFRVSKLVSPGPIDPCLSGFSWQGLLLEAAGIEDETQRRMAGAPVSRSSGVAMPPPSARQSLPSNDFSSLFEEPPPSIEVEAAEEDVDDDDETPTPVTRSPDKGLGRLLDDATEAFLLHDYPQALRLYEHCLALDPGNVQVRLNIERVRWWLGKV